MAKIIFRINFYLVALVLMCAGCKSKKSQQEQVVIYTSLDKVFSQPILEAFEKETGIKVLDVYDSEATKTTGLVMRQLSGTTRTQRVYKPSGSALHRRFISVEPVNGWA